MAKCMWFVLALLMLVLVTYGGWRWQQRRAAIAKIENYGSVDHIPQGPYWLVDRIGDRLALTLFGCMGCQVRLRNPDNETLKQLTELGNLSVLDLQSLDRDDLDFSPLLRIHTLIHLDLSYGMIADSTCKIVGQIPNLEWLELDATDISDNGLAHLRHLKRLKFLSLVGTDITDAGLVHLKELVNLQELALGETLITDVGLRQLEALTNLEYLLVAETKVTSLGVARLRKALPECDVTTQYAWPQGFPQESTP